MGGNEKGPLPIQQAKGFGRPRGGEPLFGVLLLFLLLLCHVGRAFLGFVLNPLSGFRRLADVFAVRAYPDCGGGSRFVFQRPRLQKEAGPYAEPGFALSHLQLESDSERLLRLLDPPCHRMGPSDAGAFAIPLFPRFGGLPIRGFPHRFALWPLASVGDPPGSSSEEAFPSSLKNRQNMLCPQTGFFLL